MKKTTICFALLAVSTIGLASCKCKEHEWGDYEVTKEATCANEGSKVRTCSKCGEQETEVIAKTSEHSYGEFSVTKEATCAEKGIKEKVCSVCGNKETEEIEKTSEHQYGDWVVSTPSTCKDAGVETRECSVCGAKETREAALAEHKYGEWETISAPDKGVDGEEKHVCEVCGNEETRAIKDSGVYTDDSWRVAGSDAYAFQYVDGNIVNRNSEVMNSSTHYDVGNTNMNIYQGDIPEFWSVSCKFKGTISESLSGDSDVYTGLVFDYVDENNYLGLAIRWTTWDRPNEVRSFYFFSVVDGQYMNLGDNWMDGCDLKPSSSIELTITKSIGLNGYIYEAIVSGKGGTISKSATATVGYDNGGKIGLAGANDEFTYSNFKVEENSNITKTIGYSCGDDTVTLNYYNHTYELTGSKASTGSYQLVGKTLTLTPSEGDAIILTLGDNNTFEYYVNPGYEILYQLGANESVNVLNNINGDFTIAFNYIGTKAAGLSEDDKVGVKWYQDENNYLDIYVQWGVQRDGHEEVRELSINGMINGEFTGWFDIWADGFTNLPCDGGQVIVKKEGNKFTAKLIANGKVKEDSRVISNLPDGKYDVKLYTSGTDFGFYDVSHKLAAGEANTILEDIDGDFSISFDYYGDKASGFTTDDKVGIKIYYDESNYLDAYVQWGETRNGNDEIRQLSANGYINGGFTGWWDVWTDGFNLLPYDGGTFTVTRVGNTITLKLVSADKSKEESKTFELPSGSFDVKVYASGTDFTISNIKYNVHSEDFKGLSIGTFSSDFHVSFDAVGTIDGTVSNEIKTGLYLYNDDSNYLVMYSFWANWDRPHEIRNLGITGKVNGEFAAGGEWHDVYVDGNGLNPNDKIHYDISKTGTTFKIVTSTSEWSRENVLDISNFNDTNYSFYLFGLGDTFTITNLVY